MLRYVRGMSTAVLMVVVGAGALRSVNGAPAARNQMSVRLFQFAPEQLTVRTGEPFGFRNLDGVEHSVRFGTPEEPAADSLATALPHDSLRVVVLKVPGRYEFYCERHPFMRGEITVTE